MKIYIIIISLLLFCNITSAQKLQNNEFELVAVSSVLPVIVAQSGCPIKVEDFIVTKDSNGKIGTAYSVRNTGNKAVKYYQIARWFSDNTGFIGSGVMPEKETFFEPQSIISTIPTSHDFNKITNKTKASTAMKKIVFVMILEVHFVDGSKYDAKEVFNSLETHLKLFESSYDKLD